MVLQKLIELFFCNILRLSNQVVKYPYVWIFKSLSAATDTSAATATASAANTNMDL